MHLILLLIATVMFALAGWPTAIAYIRTRVTPAEPLMKTAWLVFIGCLAMYAYLTIRDGFDPFLTVSYVIEISGWAVILHCGEWRAPWR